jgi:hypothetical protein
MKKIPIILKIIILSLIFTSCFDVNFNNPNDRYSDVYIRDNAKLSNIIISDGELSPAFTSDIMEYSVNLSHTSSSLTITPTAINDNSTMQINGSPINSGNSSSPITLSLGENEIIITTISEDLTETLEYKITVNSYDCDFSSFKFLAVNNGAYLSEDVIGVIDVDSSTIFLGPIFNDVSNLIATFTVNNDATVKIGVINPVSDITAYNFSSPVVYTVKYSMQPSGKVISKDFTVKAVNGKRISYLKAPNNSDGDNFGFSVAISSDIIAVGAPFESSATTSIINGSNLTSADNNGNGNGAVYVFRRNGSGWQHEAYLKAPNNPQGTEFGYFSPIFGYSISVSDDTIVVGTPNERSSTTNIINGSDLSSTNNSGFCFGAVYVFKCIGKNWSHEAYLKAPNGSYGDEFGNKVAISGDTIVVGAHNEESSTTSIINGSDLSATNNITWANGAAYVFRRNGKIWKHEAYLKAPNSHTQIFFGSSVSISEDTIVIGAPYENSTTTSIITGSDLSSSNNNGISNGAAYVFKRTGSIWSHEAYLKAPNNSNYFSFGYSVSISDDTIVIGAPLENSTSTSIISGSDLSSTNNEGSNNGAVYIFKRNGSIWSHEAYLKAPNNSNLDNFGYSVSNSDNIVVVGSPYEGSSTTNIIIGTDLSFTDNNYYESGAVYIFKWKGLTWNHIAYLKAPNNSYGDYFGSSVSVNKGIITVGASGEDSTTSSIINGSDISNTNDNGFSNGAVYVFY